MPLAGRDPSKREQAHYMCAERYARAGSIDRAIGHFGRALHYGSSKTSTGEQRKFLYTLQQGRLLRRIKNNRNDTKNKFFSFWIDWRTGVNKCRYAYTDRCNSDTLCTEDTYIVTRPIKLLVAPYKSIAMEDVSDYDTRLGAYLKSRAAGIKQKVPLFESAINELILQKSANIPENLDHVLIEGCCELGAQGFVRMVEPHDGRHVKESVNMASMHCYDEVAICESTVESSLLRICSDIPPPSDRTDFDVYMSRAHKPECIVSLAEATEIEQRSKKRSKKQKKRRSPELTHPII